MPTDAELLQRYVKARDERAFAELVRRHLNLVYAAALRRTNGRTHFAEEIAQKVFTDLARKATLLQHHPALTGWLHRSTRYAAIDAARRETRYQNLTQSFNAMLDPAAQPEPRMNWENLRPVIDEALDDLKESDREVMLLRYFDGLTFAEVGTRINVPANTARMRAERALDKLRVHLSKRGVTSTASALSLLLANQTLATAPAGLAASMTTTAMAVAPAGTIASLLGVVALHKAAAVWIGAGLLVGIAGVAWSLSKAEAMQGELAVLRSENTWLSLAVAALGNEPSTNTPTPEMAAPTIPAGLLVAGLATEKPALKNGEHRNHGQATAENAFLSYAWACDTGNADALAKLMTFDEAGRVELEGVYARLPEWIRTRYRTPKELIVHAQLISAVLKPPSPEDRLNKFIATEVSPERMRLRQAGSKGKGWTMVQTADGWKIELSIKSGGDVGLMKLLNNEIVVKLGLN